MTNDLSSVGGPQGLHGAIGRAGGTPAADVSFERTLTEARGVKFSAHATKRLAERHIALSETDMNRISEAAEVAAGKGSRESLFLLDNLGLIVNVRNRTVLTAIDPGRMREGIVTNIDSTVIIGADA
jgi:flagellar operon protein